MSQSEVKTVETSQEDNPPLEFKSSWPPLKLPLTVFSWPVDVWKRPRSPQRRPPPHPPANTHTLTLYSAPLILHTSSFYSVCFGCISTPEGQIMDERRNIHLHLALASRSC